MKLIIGIILILCGIVLGIYLGVYICLFGGIIDIYEAITEKEEFSVFIWGVIKIAFFNIVGWGSAFLLIIPGSTLLNNNN